MRVLHLIDSAGVYGAERVVLSLMERQRELGDEPVLGSIGLPYEGEKSLELEARRRSLPVDPIRVRRGPSFSGARELAGRARDGGFEVVHSHGYKPNILLAMLPRTVRRVPLLTTLHGWGAGQGWSRLLAYETLERKLLPRFDAVAFVAGNMLTDPRVPARRIRRAAVVPNGLAWRQPEPSSADDPIAAFCATPPVIGSFGRLSPEKGYPALISAVGRLGDRHRNVRLVILGEGPDRRVLESLIQRLGLQDRVLLPGYVDRADRYLSRLTAYVLASLSEGMPLTILEAMFAGIPIVATRVGAVPEMLEEGRGGVLVDRSDPGELARAIESVLGAPDSAVTRAAAARTRAHAEYTVDAMTRRYAELYRAVVQHRTDLADVPTA